MGDESKARRSRSGGDGSNLASSIFRPPNPRPGANTRLDRGDRRSCCKGPPPARKNWCPSRRPQRPKAADPASCYDTWGTRPYLGVHQSLEFVIAVFTDVFKNGHGPLPDLRDVPLSII